MTDNNEIILTATQRDSMQKFAARINGLGGNFAAFNPDGERLFYIPGDNFETDLETLSDCAKTLSQQDEQNVCVLPDNPCVAAVVLKENDATKAVVFVDAGQMTEQESGQQMVLFTEMLISYLESFTALARENTNIEAIGTELSNTYEELMLLYNLSTNMKVTQSNASYLQMACDQLTRLVNVEGIAIFLDKDSDGIKKPVLTAGSGLLAIDQVMADVLQVRLVSALKDGEEALLDSEVDSAFTYDWPETIKNIIAVPLQGGEKMIGLMVATNIIDKPDFDSIDIKLFNSVANQCAVFIANDRLFGDLKELFIGSLKALTSSIDAKDQYTRGHSERVAFISRWIAEKYSQQWHMDEEQIHQIYLAGLLHDIGKIGVPEAVLSKRGKLSDADFEQIKAHPRVGASILSEIKQMKDIAPGALYHHEFVDGSGYPEGLTGDQIPLIGKIICIADAFDAMTSKRVYRDAMGIKRAIQEIEKGIGTQFDKQVGEVFLKSDIRKLWSIIHDGFIESWDYSNFSEYGVVAVGSLIR